ncbi:MAG: hypothetical protein K5872_06195 [Rhizobiaceae bacterium]|nr:hypothetical protein [Rhizobiaceae bacterium]MCV0405804.1 hypothetical protein [Rhizobiaceae bacterium]
MPTSIKLIAAAAAVALAGTASSVVASGEREEGEVVVASLIILPGSTVETSVTEAAYPLPKMGVARALEFVPGEEAVPGETQAVVPALEPVEAPVENVASLDESETFREYRALNNLDFVPVPSPRPEIAAAPRVEVPAVRQQRTPPRRVSAPARRSVDSQVARVEEPRRRVLRANPILVGINR